MAEIPNVLAGIGMAREEACRHMSAGGLRSRLHVVPMLRPYAPGYRQEGRP